MAMTGYQKGNLSVSEVEKNITSLMRSEDKSFNFLKQQLRSAKDIHTKGGHVTRVNSDQIYRVMFDNKRIILDNSEKSDKDMLLDSRPLNKVEEGMLVRYISNLPKSVKYSKNIQNISSRYKSKKEVLFRNFLKALLNDELNLNSNLFKNYRDIVDYIKDYDSSYSISENYIAQLKRRGNFVKVPYNVGKKSKDLFIEGFITYVLIKFPDFNKDGLFTKIDDDKL
jgi:hypothetical protein